MIIYGIMGLIIQTFCHDFINKLEFQNAWQNLTCYDIFMDKITQMSFIASSPGNGKGYLILKFAKKYKNVILLYLGGNTKQNKDLQEKKLLLNEYIPDEKTRTKNSITYKKLGSNIIIYSNSNVLEITKYFEDYAKNHDLSTTIIVADEAHTMLNIHGFSHEKNIYTSGNIYIE
mgnify:CR=1 FL=1